MEQASVGVLHRLPFAGLPLTPSEPRSRAQCVFSKRRSSSGQRQGKGSSCEACSHVSIRRYGKGLQPQRTTTTRSQLTLRQKNRK